MLYQVPCSRKEKNTLEDKPVIGFLERLSLQYSPARLSPFPCQKIIGKKKTILMVPKPKNQDTHLAPIYLKVVSLLHRLPDIHTKLCHWSRSMIRSPRFLHCIMRGEPEQDTRRLLPIPLCMLTSG